MANDPKAGQQPPAPPAAANKTAPAPPAPKPPLPAPAPQAGPSFPAPAAQTPAAPTGDAPGEIASNPEERQLAMLAHLGGILPFGGFLPPLGLWAMKMGSSPFVEDQAKESLNLQINVLMLTILCSISCMVWVGFILVPALLVVNAAYCYMGGMAAKEGKVWRYPYNIRYLP